MLRCRVENRSDLRLPQVAFPQLLGLLPVGGADATRVRMSRGAVHPLRDLTMAPGRRDLPRHPAAALLRLRRVRAQHEVARLRFGRRRSDDVRPRPAVLGAGAAGRTTRTRRADHRPALDPLPADRAGGDLGQRRLRRAAARGRLVRRRPRVRRVRLRRLPLRRPPARARGPRDPQHVGRRPQRRRARGRAGPDPAARRRARRPGPRRRRAGGLALVAAQRAADHPRPAARHRGRPAGRARRAAASSASRSRCS